MQLLSEEMGNAPLCALQTERNDGTYEVLAVTMQCDAVQSRKSLVVSAHRTVVFRDSPERRGAIFIGNAN
jgi:hypothetical protein